jgi:ribonuclease T1
MAVILAPPRRPRRLGRATIRTVPITPSRLGDGLRLLLLALLVAVLAACGPASSTTSAPTAGGSAGSGAAAGPEGPRPLAPASPVSTLRTIAVSDLPREAVTTLTLVAAGGPFPYANDGATFSNRERILPQHPSGWYTEYTVVTPGSSDRGARRIVGGEDGARFYTDDHYASFREVISGVSS